MARAGVRFPKSLLDDLYANMGIFYKYFIPGLSGYQLLTDEMYMDKRPKVSVHSPEI